MYSYSLSLSLSLSLSHTHTHTHTHRIRWGVRYQGGTSWRRRIWTSKTCKILDLIERRLTFSRQWTTGVQYKFSVKSLVTFRTGAPATCVPNVFLMCSWCTCCSTHPWPQSPNVFLMCSCQVPTSPVSLGKETAKLLSELRTYSPSRPPFGNNFFLFSIFQQFFTSPLYSDLISPTRDFF